MYLFSAEPVENLGSNPLRSAIIEEEIQGIKQREKEAEKEFSSVLKSRN